MGELVGDMLAAEGHDVRRVATAGEARSQIIVIEDDARVTVLNEPGPLLSPPDLAGVLSALREELPGQRVAVASGSLPPGVPDDVYGRVVELARAAGALTVVDAARAALRACLPFQPDVVTPNLAEASAALSGSAEEAVEAGGDNPRLAALDAARALRGAGARAALVTVGHHGVAGAAADGCFWIAAPAVTPVNPIGAGDSFVAGLAAALERGDGLREATIAAVATGSASVAHPLAGGVDPALVAELQPALSLEPA
jgi:1-phosphofructokinase family hexose kinase